MKDRTDIRAMPIGGRADPVVAHRLGATRFWASGRLDEGPVLREAWARHRTALADIFGPTECSHEDGVETMALLVGDLAAFAEDDVVTVERVLAPAPDNGWRSQTDIRSGGGASLYVEIIAASCFGARPGAGQTVGEKPAGEEEAADPARSRGDRRSEILLSLGAADRSACEADTAPPLLVTSMGADTGAYGVADGSPAPLIEVFRSAEARLPRPGRTPPIQRLRRLHQFNAIAPDDRLEVVARLVGAVPQLPASLAFRSFARRAEDRAVVALCETVLR